MQPRSLRCARLHRPHRSSYHFLPILVRLPTAHCPPQASQLGIHRARYDRRTARVNMGYKPSGRKAFAKELNVQLKRTRASASDTGGVRL